MEGVFGKLHIELVRSDGSEEHSLLIQIPEESLGFNQKVWGWNLNIAKIYPLLEQLMEMR